jgi:predicted RNA-binding protein with PUA-like domain
MKHWLMKSEPDVFSFDDLVKAPQKTASWEGVRNYQARNFMRDVFKKGDKVLYYHSNTDEPGAVGVAEVVKEGYPDSFAMDPKHEYFDPDAKKKGVNPWFMVDVKATHKFQEPVTLERIRKEPRLKKMMVIKKGARLSVQPVTPEEFEVVLELGKPIRVF